MSAIRLSAIRLPVLMYCLFPRKSAKARVLLSITFKKPFGPLGAEHKATRSRQGLPCRRCPFRSNILFRRVQDLLPPHPVAPFAHTAGGCHIVPVTLLLPA